MNSKHFYIKFLLGIIFSIIGFFNADNINALSLDTYAPESKLKDGTWVKISVPETGIYHISNADLKKWGFSDPTKVHVYGYGGRRITDVLDNSYIDDLPLIQSVNTTQGVTFYGCGRVTWVQQNGMFVHSLNPYSLVGYYFLSDKEVEPTEIPRVGTNSVGSVYASSFTERIFHEKDLMSPGSTGHLLLGEDFKYTPSQSFTFQLTDIAPENNTVNIKYSFVTKTFGTSSSVTLTANGTTASSDNVGATSNDSYSFGNEGQFFKSFNITGDKLSLGISYKSPVTIHLARLNYITINYTRQLKLKGSSLAFNTSSPSVKLSNADSHTRVWDITQPLSIKEMNTSIDGNTIQWTNDYTGHREYIAWNENGSYPSPTFVGKVANQNIHAEPVPNMVIFTLSEWQTQAERIADIHRNSADSLKVFVVPQEHVFNEFSSGVPDVNAFRKMLKMFWDRGNVNGDNLQYALFFGRGVFDNLHLTPAVQVLRYPTMPIWQTNDGLSDNTSYSTDDFYAILDDYSGANISNSKMRIAIGRMPVKSVSEAKRAVDKLYSYIYNSDKDQWKNHFLFVADDEDNGTHMKQTEWMYNNLKSTDGGDQFFYNKIYIDAFTQKNGKYPEAHDQMLQKLDEGVLWWNYIGHANTHSWTGEELFTYNDINNLYLKRLPILYAATCEFMKWDAETTSGAEILFHNPNGGIIAAISAVRPVYIVQNGTFSYNISSHALTRDHKGNFLPLGEILRRAKNASTDDNRLRFALMGDPAMRFTTPSSTIALDAINGNKVFLNNQITIQARQDVSLKGHIYDNDGNIINDFNGIITATLYDAEKSVTSNGYGEKGEEVTFEEQGSRLLIARDSVINGEYELKVTMPSEIAHNFRQAALNMYAYSTNGNDAIGCNRDFYVFGIDENAPEDDQSPTISSYFLNHETFKTGDIVNEAPMVIATISDDKGINLSSAGIGHQMTLTLDGSKTYTDVSQFYIPDASGGTSGSIAYPMEGLLAGDHTLRLRVWDVSGNPAEETIEFSVQEGLTPKIFDIYSDANPASTEANFYITHNRPDAQAIITLTIYNLMGRIEWTTTVSGRSDMFKSFPITWNLCDMAGRRVPRGIYIYKAEISTDGKNFDSGTKRIAVTAQ